ncbi:ATP synthase subunit I [Psychrobacter jeotgali]|uniref:ATP synthase subunit I n=1 Tax=Psychrobacter jeotgali TaxID=179010 RepID=UPI00191A36B3|nr:ATP synthase subunit I [Psychrobacter jeotgali]
MTRPAKRTQTTEVALYIKRQAWVLFILIAIVGLLDVSWLRSEQLIVAKGVAIGALLSFVTQAIFASFVFRHTGYRARRNIVGQLYRGQMVKWLITVIGFALIFIYIKPLSAPALFGGFIFMKFSHILILWRIR